MLKVWYPLLYCLSVAPAEGGHWIRRTLTSPTASYTNRSVFCQHHWQVEKMVRNKFHWKKQVTDSSSKNGLPGPVQEYLLYSTIFCTHIPGCEQLFPNLPCHWLKSNVQAKPIISEIRYIQRECISPKPQWYITGFLRAGTE